MVKVGTLYTAPSGITYTVEGFNADGTLARIAHKFDNGVTTRIDIGTYIIERQIAA